MKGKKKILVVAAHPDDEVLGCGGTIARHSDDGECVKIVIVAEGATSRQKERNREEAREELAELRRATEQAGKILGASEVINLNYPDNRLDSIDRLDIIKGIEKIISDYKPDRVYVHHAGDVNIDHRRMHEAVVTACRPIPGRSVTELLSYEVNSSTEWQTPGSASYFQPNYFVTIEKQWKRKERALRIYESEMREWPHSRSIKAVEYLAAWRGTQVGKEKAEAFQLLRIIK